MKRQLKKLKHKVSNFNQFFVFCSVRMLLALQLKTKLLWIPKTLEGTLNYRKQLKLFIQRVAALSISNFWSYYFAKKETILHVE